MLIKIKRDDAVTATATDIDPSTWDIGGVTVRYDDWKP